MVNQARGLSSSFLFGGELLEKTIIGVYISVPETDEAVHMLDKAAIRSSGSLSLPKTCTTRKKDMEMKVMVPNGL